MPTTIPNSFPYTTLIRSILSLSIAILSLSSSRSSQMQELPTTPRPEQQQDSSKPASKFVKARNPIANRYIVVLKDDVVSDRKSTRLNSSHLVISYAVFCLKKKKKNI